LLLQGNLADTALGDVVRELYASRRSGVLHVTHNEISKRIYFQKGSMIFANSDVDDDRLGEFLMRQGVIDRPVFDRASEILKATGQRFGRTIVELGYLPADSMQSKVVEQIEAIIYSLFSWPHGDYEFEPKENPVDEDIVLNLSTANIILEGTRRMNDPERIKKALGNRKRVLRHSENPLLLYQKISLSPSEGFVFSRVDGAANIDEISAMSPLGEEETLRCIYGLVSAGVLNLSSAPDEKTSMSPEPAAARPEEISVDEEIWAAAVEIPKPEAELLVGDNGDGAETTPGGLAGARADSSGPSPEELEIRESVLSKLASLESLSFYDLLEVDPTAEPPELKRAYFAMAKKYHPDRHHSPHLRDIHDVLEELFARISDAYHILADPIARSEYDSRLKSVGNRGAQTTRKAPVTTPPPGSEEDPATVNRRNAAERHYVEAQRLYDRVQFFDAIRCLREAIRLAPAPKYRKLLGQALMKNPNWVREAEEQFRMVLDDNPFDTDCLIGLGEIYEQAGMTHRAQTLFERAASSDPDNAVAQQKLDANRPGNTA
jgi:DnaJ-domain-containing protein 1